jgi:hypothetical protein
MSRTATFLPIRHDVGISLSHDQHCPQCAASIRPDADWCTLCYADLRPAPPEPDPAPEPDPVPELDPVVDAVPELMVDAEPLDESALGDDVPVRVGKHARRLPSVEEEPVSLDDVDVDAMLAQLAIESDSGLGPLAGRLQSKGSKALAVTAGVTIVGVLLFVVMAILGALL